MGNMINAPSKLHPKHSCIEIFSRICHKVEVVSSWAQIPRTPPVWSCVHVCGCACVDAQECTLNTLINATQSMWFPLDDLAHACINELTEVGL